MREAENQIRDRRRAQRDQQRGPPSHSIGKPSPHRRAQQLGDGEGGDDESEMVPMPKCIPSTSIPEPPSVFT